MPLGYTYDKIVNTDRIDQYSAAEKQETTMLAAIVEDKDMDKNSNLTVATKLPLTAQKLKIKNIKLNGVSMRRRPMQKLICLWLEIFMQKKMRKSIL